MEGNTMMLEVMTRLAPRRSQSSVLDSAIHARLHAITRPLDGWSESVFRDTGIHASDLNSGVRATTNQHTGFATLEHVSGNLVAELACDERAGDIVIGRGEQAVVRLDDSCVHRMHALISWDAASHGHVITDLGGVNGTFVNGIRVCGRRKLSVDARCQP